MLWSTETDSSSITHCGLQFSGFRNFPDWICCFSSWKIALQLQLFLELSLLPFL